MESIISSQINKFARPYWSFCCSSLQIKHQSEFLYFSWCCVLWSFQVKAEQFNLPGQGRRVSAQVASLSLFPLFLQWVAAAGALPSRGKEEGKRFWLVCAVIVCIPCHSVCITHLFWVSSLYGVCIWAHGAERGGPVLGTSRLVCGLSGSSSLSSPPYSIVLLSLQGNQNNPREMAFLSSFFLVTFFFFVFSFFLFFFLVPLLYFSFCCFLLLTRGWLIWWSLLWHCCSCCRCCCCCWICCVPS